MGLLDRMRSTANRVADQAKTGAAQAREKLEDVQVRRRADDTAKQLGYLVANGTTSGAEFDDLVGKIKAFEAQLAADGGDAQESGPGDPAPTAGGVPTGSATEGQGGEEDAPSE